MTSSKDTALWANEIEFSNWLHENIQVLGDVLELELVSERREAPVGRLSADLLAKIRDSDEAVIIENQIYPANHGHFGQILTYAGHYDAQVIVCIASSFRNEYRVAFAWLNSFSHKRFYAVELRRDDVVTPFHVVARPDAALAPSDLAPSQIVVPPSKDARASEWSIVFTGTGVRLELVFNDREHAMHDIERMAVRADGLRRSLASEIVFDVVATRVKQKAIIHRDLTVEERDQDADGVAAWCAQTITLFAEAVAKLGIYEQ